MTGFLPLSGAGGALPPHRGLSELPDHALVLDDVVVTYTHVGGRTIFYEGDDPEAFRQDMIAEFGFDPAAPEFRGRYDETGEPEDHDTWGEWVPSDRFEAGGFVNYGFWCPPDAYQEVYASGRWEMGS